MGTPIRYVLVFDRGVIVSRVLAHKRGLVQSHSLAFGLLAVVVSTVLSITGCGSKGVVPALTVGSLENPVAGIPVRIEQVTDGRVFGNFAGRKLVPTMRGSDDNAAMRSRAIGRDVSSNGTAAANIFLEDSLTVESLVSDSVSRALRAEGFRVFRAGDPGAEKAIPITITIEQFWAMRSPPYSSPYVNFEVDARIAAPLPGLEAGLLVEAGQKIVRGGYSRAMWRQAMEQGLDDLTEKAQRAFSRTRLALDATRAARLVPSGSAMLSQPVDRKKHQIDFGKFYLLAIGIDQ